MKKIYPFLVLLVFFLIFGIFYYSYQINYSLSKETEKIEFTISAGDSPKNIAESLEEQKIIRSAFWLRYYLKRENLSGQIIAGTFLLSADMSIKEISEKITSTEVLSTEEEITIIEGWTNKQIAEYLEKNTLCSGKNFLSLVEDYSNKEFSFLSSKPREANLEGYLFPDTYRIYAQADCEDIVFKMLNNFEQKLNGDLRTEIKSQGKTVFEILIMASLIEKEVRSVEDMKIVSGIFWDRIKYGQALESCASLAYILGENKEVYSQADTQINSPYNTYRHRDLPPGPICSPGLNAIQAAIYPQFTDYNYFLTDPETGQTIWSKTFEEHKQNKSKYLY